MSTRARNIMRVKNRDYAGATGETPFANFQLNELAKISTTEKGILTRMLDKIMRLSTYANSGKLLVKNEGTEDACLDIINYAVLLSAYIKFQKKEQHK